MRKQSDRVHEGCQVQSVFSTPLKSTAPTPRPSPGTTRASHPVPPHPFQWSSQVHATGLSQLNSSAAKENISDNYSTKSTGVERADRSAVLRLQSTICICTMTSFSKAPLLPLPNQGSCDPPSTGPSGSPGVPKRCEEKHRLGRAAADRVLSARGLIRGRPIIKAVGSRVRPLMGLTDRLDRLNGIVCQVI